MPNSYHHGVVAEIDLNAVATNYRLLQQRAGSAQVAAVVKADAYGLGAVPIAKALQAEGCRKFYVAHYSEALTLRAALPVAEIAVLHGLPVGAEDDAAHNRILPVVSDLSGLARLKAAAHRLGQRLPIILHSDTGMMRLGFDMAEWQGLATQHGRLEGLTLTHIMSHLASPDEPASPQNNEQLQHFKNAARFFPTAKKSFANSCGIFLGPDYLFDEVRPGRALTGTNLPASFGTTLATALRLHAPILQIRQALEYAAVGYNATQHVPKGARLATVAAGYADGILRSLSNSDAGQSHSFYIGNIPCPLVGRISMDLCVIDVGKVPETQAQVGTSVDIAGPMQNIDSLAASAGTIGYEMMSLLTPRVLRRYHPVS